LNVANLTATYGDNTFILGRQLIDSPMVKGYDWLLAQGSFEAFTAVNNSIDKVTLIGTYITKFRSTYGGDEFADLEGENWAISAAYSDAFDASVWYYNIDNGSYTQVYADAGKEFSGVTVSAQYVSTNFDTGTDSDAYGIKLATKLGEVDVEAAYVNVNDAAGGFIDYDGLYTSMWMEIASAHVGGSYKVGAATEIGGLSTSVAYASFADGDVDEYNVILGYGLTDSISVDAIYSSFDDAGVTTDERVDTFELIATYKF
jgi:hypothetical protein